MVELDFFSFAIHPTLRAILMVADVSFYKKVRWTKALRRAVPDEQFDCQLNIYQTVKTVCEERKLTKVSEKQRFDKSDHEVDAGDVDVTATSANGSIPNYFL